MRFTSKLESLIDWTGVGVLKLSRSYLFRLFPSVRTLSFSVVLYQISRFPFMRSSWEYYALATQVFSVAAFKTFTNQPGWPLKANTQYNNWSHFLSDTIPRFSWSQQVIALQLPLIPCLRCKLCNPWVYGAAARVVVLQKAARLYSCMPLHNSTTSTSDEPW